ncbi:MAG: hypothetical protein FJY54_11805 [Betaproteobacteria bacterium]|nr:hypothetical protein [Betaproteobacteria bacterium]
MSVTANETAQIPPTLNEAAVRDLVEMIHLLASAKDAMSDAMVIRLARTVSEGVALLDRLTRNEGLMRLLQALDRQENQYHLISLSEALNQVSRELATVPPAKGGIAGILRLACEPGTQEGIRSLSLLGKYWGESLRELHRRGGT